MDKNWSYLWPFFGWISVRASMSKKRNSWPSVSHSSFHHQIFHFWQPSEGKISSTGKAFETNWVGTDCSFVEFYFGDFVECRRKNENDRVSTWRHPSYQPQPRLLPGQCYWKGEQFWRLFQRFHKFLTVFSFGFLSSTNLKTFKFLSNDTSSTSLMILDLVHYFFSIPLYGQEVLKTFELIWTQQKAHIWWETMRKDLWILSHCCYLEELLRIFTMV